MGGGLVERTGTGALRCDGGPTPTRQKHGHLPLQNEDVEDLF